MEEEQIHTLEFLLAFDGRVHWYEQGYFTKFEIKRIEPTGERPHTACATRSRCTPPRASG